MKELTKSTKLLSAKSIKREWHLIDMKDAVVGRIVPEIARILQGKNKTTYSPNLDMGDYVVVINASKLKLTGHKLNDKVYTRYSGYPDGLSQIKAGVLLKKNPERIITEAVSGMLPKNKLRKRRLTRLFVYAGDVHPYASKFSQK